MKLSAKFVAMVLVLVGGILGATAWMLIRDQQAAISAQVKQRAETVLSFGEASRDYARDTLSPAVSKHTKTMVFEANSATFVARGTFEAFRKRLPEYSFREASLNPLNLANQADAEEERLIRQFQANPGLAELSGYRFKDGHEQFYVARPIMVKQVCLECHDSPASAPQEVVERYGAEHGYGWKDGDLTSAIMVTVPTEDIRAQHASIRGKIMGFSAVVMVVLAALIYFLFEWLVHRRIRDAAVGMEHVAANPGIPYRLPDNSRDEIGGMAGAFNRMADSLRDSHQSLERKVDELQHVNQALNKEIVERRRAEQHIREQATLLDKATDAIMVRDLSERILYWNQGAERLYGWKAAEVLGQDFRTLVSQKTPQKLEEAALAVLNQGEWNGELRQITRTGKEIEVASRWTVMLDEHQAAKSKLIIDTDITEKKQLEAQYLRAQRMESIGTLAGGIAHDLNNVFTPILMTGQLLKMPLSESQRLVLLETLDRSAARGAALVKQILCFARGVEVERVALLPGLIVKETAQLLEHSLPKSIQLQVSVPGNLWSIQGDETQIAQVLTNLCVNARDAMPEGGHLTIAAENVFLDENSARLQIEAKPGPYVLIQVQDTGTGIPESILDKIFDPFFTTKEYGKGTGLGLSTVMGIVKGHGGLINVYSEENRGTSFAVYLPAMDDTTKMPVRPQQQQAGQGNGELILVVDDEDLIGETTKLVLQANGYRVLLASRGSKALYLFVRNQADIRLVILDMMMPVMDGPATIRALQQFDPQVRIIAVSGLNPRSQANGMPSQGKIHFLQKPYTAYKLLGVVHAILASADSAGSCLKEAESESFHGSNPGH